MSIERWNPMREFDRMQHWMRRWFDDDMESMAFPTFRFEGTGIAVDVMETEKGYELSAAVPGYKPEEIQIDINESMVTLRGEKKEEHEEKKGNYVYRERRAGTFYRQVRLPATVDSSKAEAQLKEGVLTLILPKAAETSSTRVPIKS